MVNYRTWSVINMDSQQESESEIFTQSPLNRHETHMISLSVTESS